jgi:gamma-glutamyltranspeptidase/glutathione hydrolase
MKRKTTFFFLTGLTILISLQNSFSQTYARNGMVVSANRLASEVGTEVLKKGGNVIDATVATAFALAVVHPTAGNIGGGGFIVYMDANGKTTTFDFREKAPLAASPDMYLDENGEMIRGMNHSGRNSTANHFGLKSAGVPGTVAGLWQAHQKYGKLPWAELVQPAIDLAKGGFPMTWSLFRRGSYFKENSPVVFLQNFFNDENDQVTGFGELWQQPALANTLTIIQEKGHDGFYKGYVAKTIDQYMKENGGLITKKDLSRYQAVERRPLSTSYKDFTIYSMPPPSSGGVALIEMMNLIEQADMENIEYNSANYVHLLAEVMRRAFADRAEYLGDPDFNPEMPLAQLTSKEFAKKTLPWY